MNMEDLILSSASKNPEPFTLEMAKEAFKMLEQLDHDPTLPNWFWCPCCQGYHGQHPEATEPCPEIIKALGVE